ncbi:MAG: Uncharacterised protein [Pseudidiomarina mangrovi]|nr:MAG: Uncharacterised protein [Pseudidiomarina mangrovi]
MNGETITRTYIDDIAIIKRTEHSGVAMASHEITYTLRDRLGSVVTLSNHNNLILEHRSYDPFGKPRYGTMQASPSATLWNIAGGTPFTMRGFTDHEHIDEAQLIHMNGRVYDYNLGRFLSVDPFIQEPGNSQSLNPYSYIMNNPLAGTDPSGYVSVGNLGLGESRHCDFKCMVGYQGFTEAGSSGADTDGKATVEIVMLGMGESAAEIGAPSTIGSASIPSTGSSESEDEKGYRDKYDISEPPKMIKMAEGQRYSNLSDDQKYAMHMTSDSLERALRLLKGLEESKVLAGFRVDNTVEARWYQNDTDEGVWAEAMGEGVPGRGRYTQGENVQFYGNRMIRHLPGGSGVNGSKSRELKGYWVTGLKAGRETFDYIATHEVFHAMRYSSKFSNRARAESAADTAFTLIRDEFGHED